MTTSRSGSEFAFADADARDTIAQYERELLLGGGPGTGHVGLVESLEFAVPLHILDLRARIRPGQSTPPAYISREAAVQLGTYGASLMFATGNSPSSRRSKIHANNGLARGLAALAYSPGGVTFAGLHWCTERHDDCAQPPEPEPREQLTQEQWAQRTAVVSALLGQYEAALPADRPAPPATWFTPDGKACQPPAHRRAKGDLAPLKCASTNSAPRNVHNVAPGAGSELL